MGKIVCDKYDCIFIDEYQDADENIIDSLIYSTPDNRLTIGLFGDSEQAIYENGIGSAQRFIDDVKIKLIEKEDNFRCSRQVINVVNKLRSDGLIQKVAFKEINGVMETSEERDGTAICYYSIKPPEPEKPTRPRKGASDESASSYPIDVAKYNKVLAEYKLDVSRRLEDLIALTQADIGEHVLLKLPNKSVASDAGFGSLYEIFNGGFFDTRKEIKRQLDRLQFGELSEIIKLFKNSANDKRSCNKLICLLKKQNFVIKTKEDKRKIYYNLKRLASTNEAAYAVMTQAIDYGLISLSEGHQSYLNLKDSKLEKISRNTNLHAFKELQISGYNTKKKMCDYIKQNNVIDLTVEVLEAEFNQLAEDDQTENFFSGFFSNDLNFEEVLAFYKYEEDDSNFMTMHKTKGTGIENVVVVLDEFNWTKYDFSSCFKVEDDNPSRQSRTRKLLYVACSRAKKNLRCVRLMNNDDEVENINQYFDKSVFVDLNKITSTLTQSQSST